MMLCLTMLCALFDFWLHLIFPQPLMLYISFPRTAKVEPSYKTPRDRPEHSRSTGVRLARHPEGRRIGKSEDPEIEARLEKKL